MREAENNEGPASGEPFECNGRAGGSYLQNFLS